MDLEEQKKLNWKLHEDYGTLAKKDGWALDEALMAQFESTPHEIVVDWREDDDAIVGCVNGLLSHLGLAAIEHEWVRHEDQQGADLLLSFQGRSTRTPMTYGVSQRYATLRALNEIASSELELRAYRANLVDDTHIFLGHRSRWWASLQADNPAASQRFVSLAVPIDFI